MRRLLAALVPVLLVAAGLPAEAGEAPKAGGTYRTPLRLSPKTLDPARSTETYSVTIVQQVFDGLVDFDRDLNIVPAIARSWRVSRDGRVYTFDLRPDVRFHSGRLVNAEDVVYSLTRLLRPDTRSSATEMFDVIAGARDLRQGTTQALRGVRALSPAQVEITLEESYSPFLSLLATKSAKIVPREAVESKDVPFERAPVGTGPFRFVSWEEKEIVLEAFPQHFRGRPHLGRLVYSITSGRPDVEVYREFRAGALLEAPIPADLRDEVLADQAVRVVRRPVLGFLFYGLNLSRPEWRDGRVRLAALLALDRSAILGAAARGPHRPTAGLLPPGLLGYTPERPVPPADQTRAEALLRKAGGAGRVPPIEVWSAVKSQLARAELAGIGEAWRGLGLQVETRFADDWPQFQSFLTESRMSVFRYAWYADLPDPDNVLGILFHSTSRYNYWRYASPEVDRLLEQGRTELDPVKRADIYRRAESQILADVPVIPFLQLWHEQAYQPAVNGIEVSALGAPYVPMRKVWIDRP